MKIEEENMRLDKEEISLLRDQNKLLQIIIDNMMYSNLSQAPKCVDQDNTNRG